MSLSSRARSLTAALMCAAAVAVVPISSFAPAEAAGSGAVVPDSSLVGFSPVELPANDDGSTGSVDLGFTVDFFGRAYSSLYVNNNGNVTFEGPSSTFTPYGLVGSSKPIIAAFFADVDTRGGNTVTYGTATYNGRPTFVVNWHDVGCFNANQSVLNDFQMLLVDRADRGVSEFGDDFDIVLNYDKVTWDTGSADGGDAQCLNGGSNGAAVGYSSGDGTEEGSFELAGSRASGSLVDTNTATGLIHGSIASQVLGRYVFTVERGRPVVRPILPSKFITNPAVLRLVPPAIPLLTLTANLIAETDPVIGRTVTFWAGTTQLCTVVTDAKGVATCSARSLTKARAVLQANGYRVVFDGDDLVGPSTGTGPLVR